MDGELPAITRTFYEYGLLGALCVAEFIIIVVLFNKYVGALGKLADQEKDFRREAKEDRNAVTTQIQHVTSVLEAIRGGLSQR